MKLFVFAAVVALALVARGSGQVIDCSQTLTGAMLNSDSGNYRETAVSGDSMIVGAPNDDSGSGAVYFFERDASGTWAGPAGPLLANAAADAAGRLGRAVGMEGNFAVAGALLDAGLYVYEKLSGVWVERHYVAGSGFSNSNYYAVSVDVTNTGSEHVAIVGASRRAVGSITQAGVVCFVSNIDVPGGVPVEQCQDAPNPEQNGFFGEGVAVNGDTAVVGAFGESPAGKAYIYKLVGGVWGLVSTLDNPDPANTGFGFYVDVDGDTVAIGSRGNGNTDNSFVYRPTGTNGAFELVETLVGSPPAVTSNGARIATGRTSATTDGRVYEETATNDWTVIETFNSFANHVSMDQSTVILSSVGGGGQAVVFECGAMCADASICDGAGQCANGVCTEVTGGTSPCGSGEVCSPALNECIVGDCLNDADCDDQVLCNGQETCVSNMCQNGSTDVCAANQVCEPMQDACIPGNCLGDLDCDDGNFCSGVETCVNNMCEAGTPADVCPAGQVCDENASEAYACVECIDDMDCDDGDACTGVETCVNNECVDGTPLSCNSDEVCVSTEGCVTGDCLTNADCLDAEYCNGEETCVDNTCTPGTSPCVTEPDVHCLEDFDVCVPCTTDEHCDDGVFCNGQETCTNNACEPGSDPCGEMEECDEMEDRCDAGMVGDPHVIGFLGQHFLVDGDTLSNNQVYNMVSSPRVAYNARFRRTPFKHHANQHATVTVEMGLLVGESRVRLAFKGENVTHITVEVDGHILNQQNTEAIPIGGSSGSGAEYVQRVDAKHVIVVTDVLSFDVRGARFRIPHLDDHVKLIDWSISNDIHGIMGQTARTGREQKDEEHEYLIDYEWPSFLDGSLEDYRIAGDELFGTEHVFNVFTA